MKKTVLILFSVITSFQLFSQKLKEGIVDFEISYPEMTAQMKDMENMLPKVMTVYFKNENTRTEMPTALGNTISISNSTTKQMTLLMEMMGKKIAMKISEDSLIRDAKGANNGAFPDLKITLSSETKMIAGHYCKKAIISYTESGKTERFDCFYTEELPRMNMGNEQKIFNDIKGFMMEFSMKQGGMSMKMKAKTVTPKSVSDDKFVVPSDYQIITEAQLRDVMMGGGDGKNK